MNIKGFDKDLKCRDFQFEVGKTYDTGTIELKLCSDSVFHYCKSLQSVHSYYSCKNNNRFCEIEMLGNEITDGEKFGSNKIKIVREITGEELNLLKGLINGNTGLFNSGGCNSGNCNSGNCNSGNWNSGYDNSGDDNSGGYNSGNWNSGYDNSGDYNSGYDNSGNWNSGNWNSCNKESGYFNSITPKTINIFNKPCNINAWEKAPKPNFIYFKLTEWVNDKLITYNYKEAFQKSYNNLNEEEKKIQTETLKALPNFDADVFYEISGIRI